MRSHFPLIRIRRVFNAAEYIRLMGLAFLDEFLDTLRIRIGKTRQSLQVARLSR